MPVWPLLGGMTAEQVATMFSENVASGHIPGLIDKLEMLNDEFWDDIISYLGS